MSNLFAEIRKNLNESANTQAQQENNSTESQANEAQQENTANEGVVYEELKLEGDELTLNMCTECGHLMENEMTCSECGGECNEAYKMVVRGGKVMKVKVKSKKKKLSSKQKQALAKARHKAQSGSAKKARAKSMKVRHKKIKNEGEDFACPLCDYVGEMEWDSDEEAYVCPECGALLEIDDEADNTDNTDGKENPENKDPKDKDPKGKGKGKKGSKNESISQAVQVYIDALEINESIVDEGEDAVKNYLNETYGIVVK